MTVSPRLALPRSALLHALWQQAQARVADHWAVCPMVKVGQECLKFEELELLEIEAEDNYRTGRG